VSDRERRTENVSCVVGVEQANDVEAKISLKPDDVRCGAMENLGSEGELRRPRPVASLGRKRTLIQDGSAKNSFKPSRSSRTPGSSASIT
jgi:hypothetical protein